MAWEGYGSALCTDSLVRRQGARDTLEAFGIVTLADEVDLAVDVRPSRGLRDHFVAAHERAT
jgi:hypothetical protein